MDDKIKEACEVIETTVLWARKQCGASQGKVAASAKVPVYYLWLMENLQSSVQKVLECQAVKSFEGEFETTHHEDGKITVHDTKSGLSVTSEATNGAEPRMRLLLSSQRSQP